MPRDSSGNYTLATNPVVGGEPIFADGWANPTLNDLANEMGNSLSRDGQGGMRAPFQNADGSVTAPGITFVNEPTTGLYRADTGDLRVAIAGVDIARWDSNGLSLWNGTDWDRISAGGANYYSRLDSDTALAVDTDYATISNVQPGIYHFEGWARLSRSSQTGYNTSVRMSLGPASTNGVGVGTNGSKVNIAHMEADPNYQEQSTFVERSPVWSGYATSFAADPIAQFLRDVGHTEDDFITSQGIADVTTAGDISWRTNTVMAGWANIRTGTYIKLTKVG